jgi:hypothetical protein
MRVEFLFSNLARWTYHGLPARLYKFVISYVLWMVQIAERLAQGNFKTISLALRTGYHVQSDFFDSTDSRNEGAWKMSPCHRARWLSSLKQRNWFGLHKNSFSEGKIPFTISTWIRETLKGGEKQNTTMDQYWQLAFLGYSILLSDMLVCSRLVSLHIYQGTRWIMWLSIISIWLSSSMRSF